MLLGELLARVDDAVEVRLHQVRHDVHVVEVGPVARGDEEVRHADHVLVVHVPQQPDLAHDAPRVDEVRERVRDLLDRDELPIAPLRLKKCYRCSEHGVE